MSKEFVFTPSEISEEAFMIFLRKRTSPESTQELQDLLDNTPPKLTIALAILGQERAISFLEGLYLGMIQAKMNETKILESLYKD